jgi:transcriptional regulator with XRE-family HTH domain
MAAEDMRRLVGANFARLRREKGLTQEEVSARSGFSQQYLSGLEQGRRNPTVVTLYELAQALGVGHLELLAPDRNGGGGKGGRPSGEPGPG